MIGLRGYLQVSPGALITVQAGSNSQTEEIPGRAHVGCNDQLRNWVLCGGRVQRRPARSHGLS